MQGPFTDTWVGGRQSRHAPVNRGSDNFSPQDLKSGAFLLENTRLMMLSMELWVFTGPDYGGAILSKP